MASIAEAENLAEMAITDKMATCVNIIPQALSVYAWEGRIEKSHECLLLFKTSRGRLENLQTWIKTQHPYALPAIITGIVESSPEFCHYIHNALKSNQSSEENTSCP